MADRRNIPADREHYLDNSATTQVLPEAAAEALRLMTVCYGNPSSLHTKGFLAKKELDAARAIVARRLGAGPEEIVFTGGGTEANNLALLGAAQARRRLGNRVVTTAVEHDSVLRAVGELEKQGFEVVLLREPDDRDALEEAIDGNTVLVSMMLVNNETGAFLPVQAAARAIKRKNAPALLHTDCVQAFCKTDFTPARLGADLCTVSAHKVHGPKGVGALYIKKGVRVLPQMHGGGQERGMRSGTESLPLIAAFAKAVELAPKPGAVLPEMERLNHMLRDRLADMPDMVVNAPVEGLPYILNLSAVGVRAETMLHFLAQRGVYVSAGSACGKGAKSHVLTALRLPPERVESALRVSFSRFSTEEDVAALVEGLRAGLGSLARAR
ncbi:cysteine desulfurase family protein [Acutalibacter caecimuris]|uniref:cysteine desulfurase family protein n=1 Tax=Acutalibacter caecimuris TaxID=3093657 RepID=UPI002AC9BEB4|nr:cysteine desulfurase family protein [Acutalibacter sp. M00118]